MPDFSKAHFPAMLRCAVLLRGEKCSSPWWSSTAARSGAADIRFAFPRTAMTAAFSRAAELAKALHDERTKQQGFFHLFRLPHAIEADLHREIVRLEQAWELNAETVEGFFESFLEGTSPSGKAAEGAVDCGQISIFNKSDLKQIGSLYREAFQSGKVCLPYFKLNA